MMNGREKSDSAIVAAKPANNDGQPSAELVERRAGAEGNAGWDRTRRAQDRESVSQGLDRVRHVARTRKKERFTALLHHVTPDLLRTSFFALERRAAPGVATRATSTAGSRICTSGSTGERTGRCPPAA